MMRLSPRGRSHAWSCDLEARAQQLKTGLEDVNQCSVVQGLLPMANADNRPFTSGYTLLGIFAELHCSVSAGLETKTTRRKG